MTWPIRSSEPASDEFSEAVRWYEARRPGLGGARVEFSSREEIPVTKIGLSGTVLLVLCSVVAFAQTVGGRGSGPLIRHRAPTDRALDFQLAALQASSPT